MKIGIVAPSSVVSTIELRLGVAEIEKAGFSVQLHPQCRKKNRYFAGTDEERAKAFFDYASDPFLDVVYCARGGYGAVRILPLLDRMVRERGLPPRKLLVGASDATVLMEYVRTRWGWSTLHSPMPGLRTFLSVKAVERASLMTWMKGESLAAPFGKLKLRILRKPAGPVRGELVGGNLSVWVSLLATPYAGRAHGKILFLEDIGERLYRLDRLVVQLDQAGGFQGVRAIVLGNYLDCSDAVSQGLARMPELGNARSRAGFAKLLKSPKARDLAPLRPLLRAQKEIPEIFLEVAERHGIPLFAGAPVGHGPEHFSLPLGAEYQISPDGRLQFLNWNWSK